MNSEPEKASEIFRWSVAESVCQRAERNGAIRNFSCISYGRGNVIPYVLLDPDYDWQEHAALVTAVSDSGATGLRSTGGLIFVAPRNVPYQFVPYVLLHEIAESDSATVAFSNVSDVSEGRGPSEEDIQFARQWSHGRACLTELSNVFDEGRDFSREYSNWIFRKNSELDDKNSWFNQASLRFLERRERLNREPVESVIEFYLSLCAWGHVDESIRQKVTSRFPWTKPFVSKNDFSDN